MSQVTLTPGSRATLQKLGPFVALLIISVALSIVSRDFLTLDNLLNVMRQASINALIAFGMTLVILLGGIDLSAGSVLALSSVIIATLLSAGTPAVVATFAGLLAGGLMGFANGLVISKGKVAPFIATLGSMTVLRGLALVVSNGSPISSFNSDFFSLLGGGYVARLVPIPVVLMLVMFGVFWVLLRKTVFGRHIYATGGNAESAKLSGVKVDRIQLWVYTIAGVMSALAGVVLTSRLNSAQPTAGTGYELDAIAAVVLGGTSLTGGRGWIFGTLVGALLIGVLNNGLNLLDVSSFYQQVIKGIVILLAVLIDRGNKKSS
ncbi:ABC transporter permease [Paraburkholderia silvatlantica]|uniref:Ribose/xylose/arabinose/galactoside ABC-type transport system permease subunit n=1 Tax=Paraburkholderia silvatlantica TaxID=321895 RepID=A0ABR6FJV8_9BURK|nr:ribose ABC transporter permease [Paraburkholderia silvatlantica]MBB2927715.1 ribose/xylose/arabinose/galactoside ABC-type transport system permease subunit [Paraburkholderia silvatlantica]PVY36423.1 ribose ABC transporter membrane protein [Paraburkholderia silvatlantica]PXW40160.1 ribose ABC transporter membrane protein [Paraburkholderia silvatlantica]TDQ85363.1 ribose ABC transporter membrane protein [Paraburkholderia silvatlantica]